MYEWYELSEDEASERDNIVLKRKTKIYKYEREN